MAQQVFVRDGSDVLGPYTPNQIREMAATGEIQPETHVSMDRQKWIQAGSLKGLTFGESSERYEERPSVADNAMRVAQGAANALGDAVSWIAKRTEKQLIPVASVNGSCSPRTPSGIQAFLNEEQDPAVVARLVPRIKELLMSGEELVYIAVQKKPVVNIAPDCVALTSKRFLFLQFKLMGQLQFEDRVWRELSDARIEEGVLGSTFSICGTDGIRFKLDYLPKAQARQLYRFAQEMEEKSLEERRQRTLDDSRAKAGGVVVQSVINVPQHMQQNAPPESQDDPLRKLSQLKQMLDAGLISAHEYDAKKSEILSKM